jgi:hypothetical protein
MKRFALHNRGAIENAPLQACCSALLFTPLKSRVRGQFIDRITRWIKRGPEVKIDWGATLQALEGHSSSVYAAAFSPDGKHTSLGGTDGYDME